MPPRCTVVAPPSVSLLFRTLHFVAGVYMLRASIPARVNRLSGASGVQFGCVGHEEGAGAATGGLHRGQGRCCDKEIALQLEMLLQPLNSCVSSQYAHREAPMDVVSSTGAVGDITGTLPARLVPLSLSPKAQLAGKMSNNPLLYSFCTFLAIMVFGVIVFATMHRLSPRHNPVGDEWTWRTYFCTGRKKRQPENLHYEPNYLATLNVRPGRGIGETETPIPAHLRSRLHVPHPTSIVVRINGPDTPPPSPHGDEVRPDWPEPCYPRAFYERMQRELEAEQNGGSLPRYSRDNGRENSRPPHYSTNDPGQSEVTLPRYSRNLGPGDSHTVMSNRPATPGEQV
ncbi:hypothetical protein IWX48DRAFT_591953 [Phyllosticta citricarpa]